jgi:hypothetical protein
MRPVRRAAAKRAAVARVAAACVLLVCVVCVAGAMGAAPTSAHARTAAATEWGGYRRTAANSGVTAAKTPTSKSRTRLKWSRKLVAGGGWDVRVSAPIIVRGKVFIARNNQLLRYSKSGKLEKTVTLAAPIGYTCYPGSGDGKLFIPLDGGRIQALSAATMKSSWVSVSASISATDTAQSTGTVTYRAGYLYSSWVRGGATPTAGAVVCYKTSAGSNIDSDGYKRPVWTHAVALPEDGGTTAATTAGYYNTGIALTPKAALFAGEDGVLTSVALKTGKVLSTVKLKAPVRSAVLFVSTGMGSTGVAYVSTANSTTNTGKIWRVPVTKTGKLSAARAKSAKLSAGPGTTAPVRYNNKLYVVSGQSGFAAGTATGTGKLDTFNATTLKHKSTVDLGGFSQSSPLLSKAQATKRNGKRAYLYVTLNDTTDTIKVIRDSAKQKKPTVATLAKPGGSYSMASLIADKSGTLYYTSSVTDPATWSTDVYLQARARK